MNFGELFDKKDDIGCLGVIMMVILVLACAFGLSCLYAWVAMLLWNWVMPIIWASAPVMTFWPMWGLLELCSILFKTHSVSSSKSE